MHLRRLGLVVTPLVAVSLVCVYTFVLYPHRFGGGRDPHLPDDVVGALRFAVALVAVGCAVYSAFRRATKRPLSPRVELGVSAGLAVLGVVGYLRFGDVGYQRGYHRWELFHYYLGAKYQSALRYDGIYAATAVAQAETSPEMRKEVEGRSFRDLATDTIVSAKVALDQADAIKARFSPEQWESFKRDVAWLRDACDPQWWAEMQRDHGFNASPAWMLAGRAVSGIAPAGDGFFRCLATIDLVLLAALFTAVAWAFGPRVACVALVFWGTQWPFDRTFTFGALLRQDWIFLLVLAACLAKKRCFALAGAALACSAMIRLFPGLFFVPVLAAATARIGAARRRHGRVTAHVLRPFQRFAAGAALAGVLVGGTTIAVFGVDVWPEFARRVGVHNASPSTNLMGVKTIAAFEWSQRVDVTRERGARDEFARWKQLRQERLERRAPVVDLAAAACLFLVVWVARRRLPIWMLLPLGLPLVMGFAELSNYYYSAFLLLPLLARIGPTFEVLALGTSAMSALFVTWTRVSETFDARCYFQSWVFLLACVAAVLLVGTKAVARRHASVPEPLAPAHADGSIRAHAKADG
jgi:hypothetical protein